jgi:DNA/RNA endonuclease YhcR with UshA esterase domain
MKKALLVLAVLFMASCFADIISISGVYKAEAGDTVTATGIVLAPVGLLGSMTTYIQDDTAGITLYGRSVPQDLKVGDIIKVTGKTKIYYDIPEVLPDSVEIIGTGKPRAVKIQSSNFRDYLSNLVTVDGTVVSAGKYQFTVKAGTLIFTVYIKKGVPVSTAGLNDGESISVTGIMYLYNGMFEILPRFSEDIIKK